ncbi:MAG: hypothetical protein Q4G09_02930 [Clostridia bacterium]|nr:hypothetical protein [Clostridia bacterium]
MHEDNFFEIIEKFLDKHHYYFKNKYKNFFNRDITKDKYFKFYIYLVFTNIAKSIINKENYEILQNKMAKIFNESYWMDYKYFIFVIDDQFIEKTKRFLSKNTYKENTKINFVKMDNKILKQQKKYFFDKL